jgi:nicotinamidase/pyrazinamidase
MKKCALIVVDIQNDFLPSGALGVAGADSVVPLINALVKLPFDIRVASQDWHPQKHCSFASTWNKKSGEHIRIGDIEQTLWSDHCVQGTYGADFAKTLDTSRFDLIIRKGQEHNVDSYSTFYDNKKARSTGLEAFLKESGIEDLYFAGLTTEYCIYYSVLDACDLGFNAFVIMDACRGIELQEGDVLKAITDMKARGAQCISAKEVIERIGCE